MLGTRLERHPKELRCTRTLTRTSDPFLLDHTLGRRIAPVRPAQIGLPVVPFTFSMELACEAASHLLDTPSVVTEVRDVRGYRWLALDQDELTLEVRAVLTGTDANGATVSTRIFDRGWGPASPRHLGLEQTVCLAPRWPAPPSPLDVQLDPPLEARWTVEKFYEICLFHGPCLQVLNKLRTVSQRGIEAELLIPSTAGLFENTPHPRLEIPAPMLDAAMQLAAYWVVEQDHEYFGVFPFNIGRYRQFAAPPEPGARLVCRGSLRLDGSVVIGDFDYLDGGGRVIARLEDVRLRYFEFPREFLFSLYWQDLDQSYSTKHAARMPAQRWDFLADGGGIWLRALAHITLTPKECKRWYALPEQGSERKRWLMERMVSKNAVRDWVKDAKGVKLHSVDIELVENPGGTLQPVAEQVPSIPAVALTLHDGNFVAVLENQMEVE